MSNSIFGREESDGDHVVYAAPDHYDTLTIARHWTTAYLVMLQFVLGET